MKPFDLEAAKRGEPVCTVTGDPVQIVHISEDPSVLQDCAILGYEIAKNGRKVSKYWNMHGKHLWHEFNLQMAPKKVKVYLFVQTYPDQCYVSHSCTERSALEASRQYLIKNSQGNSISEIREIEVAV